jgi:hypothetical protein
MEYKLITLDKALDKLSKFCPYIESRSDIVPEKIINNHRRLGVEIQSYQIPHWQQYEEGEISFSPNELIRALFCKLNIGSDAEILIILDSSFSSGEVFLTKFMLLEKFVEYHQDNFEFSDCLGPFDHIFYIESIRLIVILHHEGIIYRLKI